MPNHLAAYGSTETIVLCQNGREPCTYIDERHKRERISVIGNLEHDVYSRGSKSGRLNVVCK